MTDTETQGRPQGPSPPQGGNPAGPDRRHPGGPGLLLVHHRGVHGDRLWARTARTTTPRWACGAYFVAFAYAVLLLISVLVHELAHALTAKIYHWPTEKIVLNLWGGHTQFESFTASPGRSVLVAMAGPAANFVLAGGGWLLVSTAGPHRRRGHPGEHLRVGQPADRHLQCPAGPAAGRRPAGGIGGLEGYRQPGEGHHRRRLGRPDHRDRPRRVVHRAAVAQRGAGRTCPSSSSPSWWAASSGWAPARRSSRRACAAGCTWSTPAPSPSPPSDSRSPPPSPMCCALAPDGAPARRRAVRARRPARGLVDAGAVATVPRRPPRPQPRSPPSSYALGAGAYVPESSRGQELVQYLAQLEGQEYAVVDGAGNGHRPAAPGDRPEGHHRQGARPAEAGRP